MPFGTFDPTRSGIGSVLSTVNRTTALLPDTPENFVVRNLLFCIFPCRLDMIATVSKR